MSELASDHGATMALQQVRVVHHLYKTAELSLIASVQGAAQVFGTDRAELAEIIGEDLLNQWAPVRDDLFADWDKAAGLAEHDPNN